MKINNKLGRWPVLFIAILIILPATLPIFKSKFFQMHDYTHVARLVEMQTALNDGHFPVRWSKNLGWGFGMPLFNFYAPLSYYLSQIPLLFGLSHLNAIKIIFYLNFLASFLAMYYLAKLFWGKIPSLVAATAFVYAPYHAVQFYVRGTLSELTAVTFIPISLYCLTQLTRKRNSHWIGLSALSLAGIILSHNLIAFISVPVLFIVALAISFSTSQSKPLSNVLKVASSFILSGLLSSFYALPAFFEKSFTQVEKLTQEYSNYSHHFLYLRQLINSPWGYGGSIFGLLDNVSFEIGKLHILLAATAAITFFKIIKTKKRQTVSMIVISVIVIFLSIFMTSFKSKIIWDNLLILSFIQFPWRFLSLIIVFSSFLSAAAIWNLSKKPAIQLLSTISIIILIIVFYVGFFKPESYLDNNDLLYYTDPNRIQKEMSSVIPDYLPAQVKTIPDNPPQERFIFSDHINNVDIQVNRTQEFLISLNVTKDTTMTANIFYFPGWKFFIDGQLSNFEIDENLGIMNLVIPSGEHLISGKFTNTPLRQAANLLSILGLFLTLILIIKIKPNVKN